MENAYNMNRIVCEEITSCKFALVSKFLKIQHINKEELINVRKHLLKISELEEAMMNRSSIDVNALEIIKEYVNGETLEYRTKIK